MVELDAQADVWAGLGSAIEAFERGLDEYQTRLEAWSQHRRKQISRETAMAEERTSASTRGLEERAQQLARDQEALARDKAELVRFKAELDALATECDRRERASREREATLGQKFSSHEQVTEFIENRTKQLDQRERDLESKFGKIERDFAERQSILASTKKKLAEQSLQIDHEHQNLVRFRDELASQSDANQEAQNKLAVLSSELDARQKALASEDEAVAARRGQVDRQKEELLSLQSQLQARQAEIDARALALNADTQRLKQQSDVLSKREHEFEQTAAKRAAEHQMASLDLERRERELADATQALVEREGELNGKQAKLEVALQSLRNDQTAVEKARNMVAEVDESRWSELNKVRAELNAMRMENELARTRERELVGSLGQVQAANAREMHAAEVARTEAARLADQLEDEKRTVAQLRTAIERREHEFLALLAGVEAKSAGSTALVVSSPNDSRVVGLPSGGGTLLVQRQASHTAVATFWADFKRVSSTVENVSVEAARTTEAEVRSSKFKEAGYSNFELRTLNLRDAVSDLPSKQPAPVSASVDLDPVTADRLRMLRRLNPAKSDQELLSRISAEEKNPPRVKRKKSWFALR